MNKYSKIVFNNIFSIVANCSKSKNDKHCTALYRSILDNISINILFDSLENTDIIKAVMKLSVLERLIIVLYFILDYNLKEISAVIHTTQKSVYTQKSKAVKKMRTLLNSA